MYSTEEQHLYVALSILYRPRIGKDLIPLLASYVVPPLFLFKMAIQQNNIKGVLSLLNKLPIEEHDQAFIAAIKSRHPRLVRIVETCCKSSLDYGIVYVTVQNDPVSLEYLEHNQEINKDYVAGLRGDWSNFIEKARPWPRQLNFSIGLARAGYLKEYGVPPGTWFGSLATWLRDPIRFDNLHERLSNLNQESSFGTPRSNIRQIQ